MYSFWYLSVSELIYNAHGSGSISVGTMDILNLYGIQETASKTTRSKVRKEDTQSTDIQGFCIQFN